MAGITGDVDANIAFINYSVPIKERGLNGWGATGPTPEPEPPSPIEPDAPSDWAREAWEWAVANGMTDGTAPRGTAAREMVAVMIYRAWRKDVCWDKQDIE